MSEYATIQDVINLKRSLTSEEQTRAGYLIPIISNLIRVEAQRTGRDYDQMIAETPILADVAKSVTCDVVIREINTPGTQLPATSYSEGAGGVTQSYTLPNSSGAIKLWPSDMKALGLKVQKIDALNLMKARGRCF